MVRHPDYPVEGPDTLSAEDFYDCSLLQREDVPPVLYAVDGLIPRGTVGDLFGPSGVGKSSLTMDLAIAVASGAGSWFGRKCISGSVLLLGSERSSREVLARDISRASQNRHIKTGKLIVPRHPQPVWRWDRSMGVWDLTKWGCILTRTILTNPPALIILDTTFSVALGLDPLDNVQQYMLGEALINWASDLGNPVVLTISHTNKASASQFLHERLHHLSRAGGGGLTNSLRWAAGLSKLKPEDVYAKEMGLSEHSEGRKLFCLGVSKGNEMPSCSWSSDHPAVFELLLDGSVKLVAQMPDQTSTRIISKKTQRRRGIPDNIESLPTMVQQGLMHLNKVLEASEASNKHTTTENLALADLFGNKSQNRE